jgi:ATP-dependent DNA ligase
MHPKTEIKPDAASVKKILDAGWWGQKKIHGHRAQIHLPSDRQKSVKVYNRHGKPHAKALSKQIIDELYRILPIQSDWTVVEAEWLKGEDKLYLFDVLKLNGKLLNYQNYEQRWSLLPKVYASPYIETLMVYSQLSSCMEVLESEDEDVEGLVFKSRTANGFRDTAIIRCRKISARLPL